MEIGILRPLYLHKNAFVVIVFEISSGMTTEPTLGNNDPSTLIILIHSSWLIEKAMVLNLLFLKL